MPSFCRHNRLIHNCPICAREQDLELRPVVSPGGQTVRATSQSATRGSSQSTTGRSATRGAARTAAGRGGSGLKVRRLARGADDGYRSELAPGLRSSQDAARLADEIAFAAARLATLTATPPGLYAEVADPTGEIEERTWLAFLIALLGPTEDDDPFAAIAAARTSWASAEPLRLEPAQAGPRGTQDAATAARAAAAYRAWVSRIGSQEAAFTGEPSWTSERRFARLFERLALPGFPRGARFELLTTLGRAGVYELRARALALGGSDDVTAAAKRLLGIGDPILLERRAASLAEACGIDIEAFDLGFYNWERGERARVGMDRGLEPDAAVQAAVEDALGL